MSKKITNTTRDERMEFAVLGGNPAAIEAQEQRGQAEIVNAEVLPTDGLIKDRAVWEAMGIKIGDTVDGDPLFTHVELPAGWKKQRTDHHMWSDLVDDKGRKRGGIGYKAAFYDRWASIHPERRFRIERDYNIKDAIALHVEDNGATVYTARQFEFDASRWTSREAAERSAHAMCAQWLTEQGYPDWQNPAAYWE